MDIEFVFPGPTLAEVEKEQAEGREKGRIEKKFRNVLLAPDKKKKDLLKGPPVVTYKVIARSHARSSHLEEKTLPMVKVPVVVNDIKEAIEILFDIPVATQKLTHNLKELHNDDRVVSHNILDGDTLEMTYFSEGQLEETRVIVNWMRYLATLIKEHRPAISTEISAEADMVVTLGLKEELFEDLANKKFCPWESPIAHTNKIYFLQLGGITSLFTLYHALLSEPWKTMLLRLKFLESGCILVLGNLGVSIDLRKEIISEDGVGMIIQSFRRVRLRRGMPLTDSSGSPGKPEYNDFLIKELIQTSLKALLSFRECPELHDDIASSFETLEQLVSVIHCPSLETIHALRAAFIICCCTHNLEVIRWLCRANAIDGLLDAATTREVLGADKSELMLFNYFALEFVSHLFVHTPEHVSKRLFDKIQAHMEKFLKIADYQKIAAKLKEVDLICAKLLPIVRLAFGPRPHRPVSSRILEHTGPRITQLQELSIETAILSLQCMLVNSRLQRGLVKEGLVEYVFCLPSVVPPSCKQRALNLVAMVTEAMQLNPPKLVTIAKAKVAKMHFGLDRVRETSAEELYHEIYPPPPVPVQTAAAQGPPSNSLLYIIAIQ